MATNRSMFVMPERGHGRFSIVRKETIVSALAKFTAEIGLSVSKCKISQKYDTHQLRGMYLSLSKRNIWPWRFVHLMRDLGRDVWPVIVADALMTGHRDIDDGRPLVGRVFSIHGELWVVIRETEEQCLEALRNSYHLSGTTSAEVLSEFAHAGGTVSRLNIRKEVAV